MLCEYWLSVGPRAQSRMKRILVLDSWICVSKRIRDCSMHACAVRFEVEPTKVDECVYSVQACRILGQ